MKEEDRRDQTSEIKYIFSNNKINKYNEKVLKNAKKARRDYYELLFNYKEKELFLFIN